jgi:hypothetical protein
VDKFGFARSSSLLGFGILGSSIFFFLYIYFDSSQKVSKVEITEKLVG